MPLMSIGRGLKGRKEANNMLFDQLGREPSERRKGDELFRRGHFYK